MIKITIYPQIGRDKKIFELKNKSDYKIHDGVCEVKQTEGDQLKRYIYTLHTISRIVVEEPDPNAKEVTNSK